MKNIIEITEENYQKWEDILQIGYDVEDRLEDKEVFEIEISKTELKSYMWAGNEKMIKIIEEALNDYDDKKWEEEHKEYKEEEEEEEYHETPDDNWWIDSQMEEMIINNYGWD